MAAFSEFAGNRCFWGSPSVVMLGHNDNYCSIKTRTIIY